MKKQKMSLEKMKTVLKSTLSRNEMKEVMAGSGPYVCGGCYNSNGSQETCWNTLGLCEGCGRLC